MSDCGSIRWCIVSDTEAIQWWDIADCGSIRWCIVSDTEAIQWWDIADCGIIRWCIVSDTEAIQWWDIAVEVSTVNLQSRVLGVYPIPSRLEALGEQSKLPQQGLGWSPRRKQFLDAILCDVTCVKQDP